MPCRTRRTAVEALCAARPDPGASPDIRVTATESPARFSSPCRCAVVDVRSGQKLQLCTARPFRSVVRWSGRSEAPALHGSSFPVGGAVVGEVRSSSSARPVLSTSSSGGLVQKLQLCMAGPLYVEVRWSGRSEAPALHDSFLSGRWCGGRRLQKLQLCTVRPLSGPAVHGGPAVGSLSGPGGPARRPARRRGAPGGPEVCGTHNRGRQRAVGASSSVGLSTRRATSYASKTAANARHELFRVRPTTASRSICRT
jgi:hypothetical protein